MNTLDRRMLLAIDRRIDSDAEQMTPETLELYRRLLLSYVAEGVRAAGGAPLPDRPFRAGR